MRNQKVSLLCACTAAALALPGAASAQSDRGVHIDPGVNYDPGSPAGKEYAIPLVEGRSDAAGTTDQQEGANIPFGVGIKPPGGKGGGPGQKDRGGDGSARRDNGSGRRARDELPGARRGEYSQELAARIARAEEPSGTAART